MLTIGLRFDRRDARRLRALAEQWAAEGTNSEQVGLFTRAAEDAARGEPLRVLCSTPEEALTMASLFATLGTSRPAVEALPNT